VRLGQLQEQGLFGVPWVGLHRLEDLAGLVQVAGTGEGGAGAQQQFDAPGAGGLPGQFVEAAGGAGVVAARKPDLGIGNPVGGQLRAGGAGRQQQQAAEQQKNFQTRLHTVGYTLRQEG